MVRRNRRRAIELITPVITMFAVLISVRSSATGRPRRSAVRRHDRSKRKRSFREMCSGPRLPRKITSRYRRLTIIIEHAEPSAAPATPRPAPGSVTVIPNISAGRVG